MTYILTTTDIEKLKTLCKNSSTISINDIPLLVAFSYIYNYYGFIHNIIYFLPYDTTMKLAISNINDMFMTDVLARLSSFGNKISSNDFLILNKHISKTDRFNMIYFNINCWYMNYLSLARKFYYDDYIDVLNYIEQHKDGHNLQRINQLIQAEK